MAPEEASDSEWEVVGGRGKGGIIAREGKTPSAPELGRLATGSRVRVLEWSEDRGRLRYELLHGDGPPNGWVAAKLNDRDLLVKAGESVAPFGLDGDGELLPEDLQSKDRREVLMHYGRRFGVPIKKQDLSRPAFNRNRKPFEWNQYNAIVVAARPGEEVREELARYLCAGIGQRGADGQGHVDQKVIDGQTVRLCRKCQLPLGERVYKDKDAALLHGECAAQAMLRELSEKDAERKQKEQFGKMLNRSQYGIGWRAEQIPSNAAAATKLGCQNVPQGMCCIRLDEKGLVQLAATVEPAAAISLEYLSIALQVRSREGREPFFSLDPMDSANPSMQEKRFDPEWLAGTSVGEVMFQADYHLKELSMGEYEQPIVGMKSCMDYFENGENKQEWNAREWFTVQEANVFRSRDKVLIPFVKMGVEAREQVRNGGILEDAPLTKAEHPLVKYAKAFTNNFDLIAERKSVIFQLRELAKAVVLAKLLVETRTRLPEHWLQLAGAANSACSLEVPQLWNERFRSQIHVRDGTIIEAENGLCERAHGVYGGVQFGLDRFTVGARPATLSASVVGTRGVAPRVSAALSMATSVTGGLRAPTMLRAGAARAGISMQSGMARGVDLNLNRFSLVEHTSAAGIWACDLESPEARVAIGDLVLASLDSKNATDEKSIFRAEDLNLLRHVYNPSLCDRRDEGKAFVPMDTSYSYVEALRDLVKDEEIVREIRARQFLSPEFSEEDPGDKFPTTWNDTFHIARDIKNKNALYSRPDFSVHTDVFEYFLQSAQPDFDKSTEDGIRFRIYRFGTLEARTTQAAGKKETLGAVFSIQPPLPGPTHFKQMGDHEKIVKATEYVEWDKDTMHHTYVVFETEQGLSYVTEMLGDGSALCDRAPRTQEIRNSLAKVIRSTENCRSDAIIKDVRDMSKFQCRGNQRTRPERLAFARAVYNLTKQT